jgi:hypothetical protein
MADLSSLPVVAGGFGLVIVGCGQSGGVGVSALCGVAVRRVVRVRAKRHPHAQQASQRDCPPFRLAKSVFFTGRRLRCRQPCGQPLTVTLGFLSTWFIKFVLI